MLVSIVLVRQSLQLCGGCLTGRRIVVAVNNSASSRDSERCACVHKNPARPESGMTFGAPPARPDAAPDPSAVHLGTGSPRPHAGTMCWLAA